MIFYVFLVLVINTRLSFTATDQGAKVLLVAVDGFRWDFRDKAKTPNLDSIVANGVTSEYVVNVFPTSTLPNHQSIVTGLYPENHGMIDNSFLDPDTGEIFNGLSGESGIKWWNQSIPIWTVNELQGHHSGVLFWPGHRVKYEGQLATYLPSTKYTAPYEPGKWKMPLSERVDTAIKWLKKDDVNLVVLYTEEPDDTAHEYGPDNEKKKNTAELKKTIEYVDEWIGYMNKQLEEENLTSTVNVIMLDVIMLGDHGHVNTTYQQHIYLDDYFDTKKELRYIGAFTNVFMYTKEGRDEFVYESLKNSTELMKHYSVYLKKDIPEKFHIKNNRRMADVLLLPDSGWTASTRPPKAPYLKGKWERGDHGYDFEHREMNPAFFGYGPSLRKGYHKQCIHTVDVYNLMCHILGIEPRDNDGKFERVKSFLLDSGAELDDNESKRGEVFFADCEDY